MDEIGQDPKPSASFPRGRWLDVAVAVALIAAAVLAVMTGRAGRGLELNPAYVDVIVRRWQLFTGRHALHQASGQLFVERIETQHRG